MHDIVSSEAVNATINLLCKRHTQPIAERNNLKQIYYEQFAQRSFMRRTPRIKPRAMQQICLGIHNEFNRNTNR